MQKNENLYEEIAIAYDLYEKRGGTHGLHDEDWMEAERIVIKKQSPKLRPSVQPKGRRQ